MRPDKEVTELIKLTGLIEGKPELIDPQGLSNPRCQFMKRLEFKLQLANLANQRQTPTEQAEA